MRRLVRRTLLRKLDELSVGNQHFRKQPKRPKWLWLLLLILLLVVPIVYYRVKPVLPPWSLDYFFYLIFIVGIGGLIRGVIELYVIGGWRKTPRQFSAYTEVVNRTSYYLILLSGTVLILWLT